MNGIEPLELDSNTVTLQPQKRGKLPRSFTKGEIAKCIELTAEEIRQVRIVVTRFSVISARPIYLVANQRLGGIYVEGFPRSCFFQVPKAYRSEFIARCKRDELYPTNRIAAILDTATEFQRSNIFPSFVYVEVGMKIPSTYDRMRFPVSLEEIALRHANVVIADAATHPERRYHGVPNSFRPIMSGTYNQSQIRADILSRNSKSSSFLGIKAIIGLNPLLLLADPRVERDKYIRFLDALLFRDQIIDVYPPDIVAKFSPLKWRGRQYLYKPTLVPTTWGEIPFWSFFRIKIRESLRKKGITEIHCCEDLFLAQIRVSSENRNDLCLSLTCTHDKYEAMMGP